MPIWKFTQNTGEKSGSIESNVGISVSFEGDSPQKEIDGQIGLSASFEIEQVNHGISAGVAVDVSFDAIQLLGELEAGAGISAEIQAEAEYLASLTASVGIQATMEAVNLSDAISGNAGVQATFERSIEANAGFEGIAGLSASFECFNWSEFIRQYGDQLSVRFYFTLTGKADGLSDITIPMSSFQFRYRLGSPSYLSVVVPGKEYAAEIADRSNGVMIIQMAYEVDGEILQAEIIASADLEDIRLDEGGTNASITLVGYKTFFWHAPKNITLTGLYKCLSNGKRRYRCEPNFYILPGDYATVNGDTFQVNMISWTVGANERMMEVAEYNG